MNETEFENTKVISEEEAMSQLNRDADRARAMLSLQEDPRFKMLFSDIFITGWALTQTSNLSVYQPERRVRVMEQMLARSVFVQFCQEMIENGRLAIDTLQEIKAEEEIQDAELS